MNKISRVQVHLAESAQKSLRPSYKCGSIVSLDRDGEKVRSHHDLIDNVEFRSKHELILNIAYKIGVGTHVVSIEN